MYVVDICTADGKRIRGELRDGAYRIGTSSRCHIQLSGEGISEEHCLLYIQGSRVKLADLNSDGGTYLDDDGVAADIPLEAFPGQKISVGDVEIFLKGLPGTFREEEEENEVEENEVEEYREEEENPPLTDLSTSSDEENPLKLPPPPAGQEIAEEFSASENEIAAARDALSSLEGYGENEEEEEKKKVVKEDHPGLPAKQIKVDGVTVLAVSGVPFHLRKLLQEIKKRAHAELIKRLNLKRLTITGTSGSDLNTKAKETIHEIVNEIRIKLPEGLTKEEIEKELVNEAIGLGPLEELIDMPGITEIMVNGPDHVYVEYKGKLQRTDMSFADNAQVLAAIERIVSPLGRRIDESSPMVDARLKDGSRVNAIIPPLSLVGPSITIRKFSKNPLQVDDLVRFGSITHTIADFLDLCVKIRKNIIISGGTGSGKTTLLNILSGFLPDTERIVTIEDAAELQLRQDHVVRLEARPANIEGKGEVSIRDLVKNSLRMRPDRIVIGECRGGEALDMLQAMNTGHDGSLTTIHANSPRDALARLETLVLMSGFDLPLRAIREQIASAITLIVQISREKDGTRKVNCVSEITKMEGDIITMQDIFVYKQTGWTEDGKMTGEYVPTGNIPTFMDEITRAGLSCDISMFSAPRRNGGSL
ncbi:MAG: Flp pilus assembly complex ATPase component TadA [Lentisphaeria bacterium]|nr:Flp pilus assembly complex ATPase component TadA [Lentisphaeria bacterium]